MTGAASTSTVFFDPNRAVMKPNESDPMTAPRQLIEPTHETSSIVSAPVDSGVESDARIGSAGDTLENEKLNRKIYSVNA